MRRARARPDAAFSHPLNTAPKAIRPRRPAPCLPHSSNDRMDPPRYLLNPLPPLQIDRGTIAANIPPPASLPSRATGSAQRGRMYEFVPSDRAAVLPLPQTQRRRFQSSRSRRRLSQSPSPPHPPPDPPRPQPPVFPPAAPSRALLLLKRSSRPPAIHTRAAAILRSAPKLPSSPPTTAG